MRKEQLVSIGRFAAKLGGSCLILGLGAVLLDPGMLAVFRKAPDVSGGTVKRSLPVVAKHSGRSHTSEYWMETPESGVHYRSEFFNGSLSAARNRVAQKMRGKGFVSLELPARRESGQSVMLFRKGNALTGVMLRREGQGWRIVHAAVERGNRKPVCPDVLRGLEIGRVLLCMYGRDNAPFLVTGSPAGVGELEKQLSARLKQQGWLQEESMSKAAAGSGMRLMQARKGRFCCDISIAPGSGELSGMNTVTYKLTMI